MIEIWKDIENYEGLYKISNTGKIKSTRNNIELKQRINNKGRYYINLSKNGKYKSFAVHRLVAKAFINNPNNFPDINHKDENPLNNNVTNLEWCTKKYNNNYGTRIERIVAKQNKPIIQYDLNGNFIKKWNSIKEAQLFYNTNVISQCCKHKKHYQSAKGFIWEYENEKEITKKEKVGKWLEKKVNQYDLNNKFIATYNSIKEAGKLNNIYPQNISKCCLGKYKTCGNYKWKFLEGGDYNKNIKD